MSQKSPIKNTAEGLQVRDIVQSTSVGASPEGESRVMDRYTIEINNILVDIRIITYEAEAVPEYVLSIANISATTKIILEKIRQEFCEQDELRGS